MKRKKNHWMIRSTWFILKWGLVASLIILRFAANLVSQFCSWGLVSLGIKPRVRTYEPEVRVISARPLPQAPPPPVKKEEWVKEGKAKDGMRIERNTLTGKKRVVVERTNKVLPIDVEAL